MFAPEKTAFLFPGQGSQVVGMGSALAAEFPTAREIFRQADQILGFALSEIAWNGPLEILNDTVNTQPALLVHSVAVLSVFGEIYPGYNPAFVAGHSMGELSALVAAGALDFPEALKLVRTRGEAMKMAGEKSPGGMAAILGLDIPTLDQLCEASSLPGEQVQVANDNCPGQVVISGATPALDRALELAKTAGAKRVIPLAVSIAAHSELMSNAQSMFIQAVQSAPIQTPTTPIIGNVSAAPLEDAASIQADLKAQLTSRVRWTETIQWMAAQGITQVIELGSEAVLIGLVRRINRDLQGMPLGTPDDFQKLAQLSV